MQFDYALYQFEGNRSQLRVATLVELADKLLYPLRSHSKFTFLARG
jgi:hypothetical protein